MAASANLSLAEANEQLKRTASKRDCLTMAYELITATHYGDRYKTITRLWELWPSDMETLWNRPGFLHCTNFNRLLRALLLKSGHFKPAEIRYRWTNFQYHSIHQYLRVDVATNETIAVDAWARRYGLPLGEYAHGWRVEAKIASAISVRA